MKSWRTYLVKNIWPDLSQEHYEQILSATVAYLVGATREKEYHRELASIAEFPDDLTPKGFRLRMRDTAYMIVNVKFCAMFMVKAGRISNYAKLASDYSIHPSDMDLLRKIVRSRDLKNPELDGTPINLVESQQLQKVKSNIAAMLPDLERTYIRYKVHKELRYIYLYSNESAENYVHDLIGFAIHAYYKSTPKVLEYSHEHAFRRIRTALDNRIKCIHDYHNAGQRARLKDAGFDANGNRISVLQTVSQCQMPMTSEGEEVEYDQLGSFAHQDRSDDIRDMACCVDQLLRKFKSKPRSRECIEILFDVNSVEFKQYLTSNKMLRESNVSMDEVFEYLGYDSTLKCLSNYLDIHVARLRGFMGFLKTELSMESLYAG